MLLLKSYQFACLLVTKNFLLRKKSPNTDFFPPYFSCIFTLESQYRKYGKIQKIHGKIRSKKVRIGTLFRSVPLSKPLDPFK